MVHFREFFNFQKTFFLDPVTWIYFFCNFFKYAPEYISSINPSGHFVFYEIFVAQSLKLFFSKG
jgi:hypothetical protein